MKARPNSTYVLNPKENGCAFHNDCFTCPYDECNYTTDKRRIDKDRTYKSSYYEARKEYFRQWQREYYQRNKERIKAKREAERRIG